MRVDATPSTVSLRRARPFKAWIAGLAVMILACAVGFAVWSRVSTGRQVEAARQAIDSGRLDEAEKAVASLSRSGSRAADVAYLRAQIAWARNDPSAVLTHLKTAKDLGYPEPPMDRLVGLIKARGGQPRTAEPLLLSAWETLPGPDPDVADALCRIYVESFRFKPAMAVLDRWLAQNPDDLRAWLWRAEVHSRNDPGLDVQIRDYDEVLKRAPDHLGSRLGRANALRLVGRLDEAKRDYDLYLKERPDDAEALFGAAKTAEGLDEADQALAFYERVLQKDPENVLGLLGKSAILLSRKKYQEAIELLDLAIARLPHDPEPHYRRGQALERLGRTEEAAREFAERKKLQAEQEHIEKIRKALVRNPTDTALMAEAASWLLDRGYREQGLQWARKLLAVRPDHAPTLNRLVDLYEKDGNPGLANFYRSQLPPDP